MILVPIDWSVSLLILLIESFSSLNEEKQEEIHLSSYSNHETITSYWLQSMTEVDDDRCATCTYTSKTIWIFLTIIYWKHKKKKKLGNTNTCSTKTLMDYWSIYSHQIELTYPKKRRQLNFWKSITRSYHLISLVKIFKSLNNLGEKKLMTQ